VKPYVQGSVGIARTNFGTDYNNTLVTTTLTKTYWNPDQLPPRVRRFAGVDIAILPFVDFRMVDWATARFKGTPTPIPLNHSALASSSIYPGAWESSSC